MSVLQQFDLTGRVALVTGASRGLGVAMATALAEAGARVVVTSTRQDEIERSAAAIAATTGRDVVGVAGDVSSEDDSVRVVSRVEDTFGRLDILVNNAGINLRGSIDELPLTDFTRSWQVNVTGSWLMCRAAKRLLEHSDAARVVNIGSTFGSVAAPNRTAYTTAKGAFASFTRAMAVEWAKHGLQANAIGPGYFVTDLNQALVANPEFNRWICGRTPAGRWGQPQELSGAVVFLASAASDFVNGQVLYVDGGLMAAL